MGDFASIYAPLANVGAVGVLIAYLIWDKLRADRLAEKDIESRKELAVALALLTEAVRGSNRGRR